MRQRLVKKNAGKLLIFEDAIENKDAPTINKKITESPLVNNYIMGSILFHFKNDFLQHKQRTGA